MGAMTTVQAIVDSEVMSKAEAVLEESGLTVSEALRMLLTKTADDGALPFSASTDPAHDAWFRAKVQEALDDPRPPIPAEEVEAYFTKRRAAALEKATLLSGESSGRKQQTSTASGSSITLKAKVLPQQL